jgi:pyruvate dehydrogenase E1 component beta subunit
MPATPYDAKGLLISAVRDPNPVVFLDDRWLYKQEMDVPEEMYEIPLGKAAIHREGSDLTIAATSHMVLLADQAADELKRLGVRAEVVNVRSLKPLDEATILGSVRKTGRLVVADGGWRSYGAAAEIAALAAEKAFSHLEAAPARVTLPDAPAPSSSAEERAYYPTTQALVEAAMRTMKPA